MRCIINIFLFIVLAVLFVSCFPAGHLKNHSGLYKDCFLTGKKSLLHPATMKQNLANSQQAAEEDLIDL